MHRQKSICVLPHKHVFFKCINIIDKAKDEFVVLIGRKSPPLVSVLEKILIPNVIIVLTTYSLYH
jgi:hypothetical protein